MTKRPYRKSIGPIHHSIRPTSIRTPYNMDRIVIPREMVEAMDAIALDIFADCTNVGVPFQDCLTAIYLSGLEHGSTLRKEQLKPKTPPDPKIIYFDP